MRLWYRARQFWHALIAFPAPEELAQVEEILAPAQMALFRQMHRSEQAHSLQIFLQLRARYEQQADVWVAALLHDVGKSCYPLTIWERVVIVLGRAWFPGRVKAWGQGEPRGWKRPFVVAEQHPAWGAEMAQQAGASPLAVSLIGRHQEPLALSNAPGAFLSLEDRLLLALQTLDENR